MSAPIPACEAERLAALHRYRILDTDEEQIFDDLTRLAAVVCGTPMAMISLIDEDRQWFKSRVGTDVRETPRDLAFCAHAILQEEVLVVPDSLEDPRFRDNPLARAAQIRFYAGAPLITPDGHALGTLCTVDRTPRQLTEEQLDALRALARQAMSQIQVRRSYLRLQELEGLRESLTHMVVHDLRTPLTSVLTGLRTLGLLGELSDPQRECLRLAVAGGENLLGMINDLLDVARMEEGSLPLELEEVELESVAARALQEVRGLAELRGLQLESLVEPGTPQVVGDREKLVRVLVNLLGNALKFTPAGGRVALRIGPDESGVRLSVSDTGEGIPREAFDRIFEKFGQVEERKGGRRSSTGLGLTFCKMTVEAHGGRIWVESEVGEGSTFHVLLPLAPPDRRAPTGE